MGILFARKRQDLEPRSIEAGEMAPGAVDTDRIGISSNRNEDRGFKALQVQE